MTGLELLLTSTTLAALALWLVELQTRRAWEHLAISNGERLAELSRGIDPRRDALWPPVDLGPYLVTTQLDESEPLS